MMKSVTRTITLAIAFTFSIFSWSVPSSAITVNPGDTLLVNNFSPIPTYPYAAPGLYFLIDSSFSFDYSLFDGFSLTAIDTGTVSSSSFTATGFTLANSTAHLLLTNFTLTGNVLVAGLHAPELMTGSCETGCTPIRFGQFSQVNAVPIPAALPLFAAGLGAMGFMGWRKRRKP